MALNLWPFSLEEKKFNTKNDIGTTITFYITTYINNIPIKPKSAKVKYVTILH